MKIILTISMFMMSGLVLSQSWQTISADYFGKFFMWGATDWTSHRFKINSYDNSLWIARDSRIMHLEDNGNYSFFDNQNTAVLDGADNYREFAFLLDSVFITGESTGLYRYYGSTWTNLTTLEGGVHISNDSDTLWFSRSAAGNSYKFVNGIPLVLPTSSNFNRIMSKNGFTWISTSSIGGTGIRLYDDQTGNSIGYYPSSSNLISTRNNDFKFSPNSDSMYVASDLGISIAYQDSFVDSLTVDNTVNMPNLQILEFEFDSQDNIWATFGSGINTPEKIAFLDRSINTWTNIYDASNSPIDYSWQISIEIDTSDNLWVVDRYNLHILKINNPPTWLGIEEDNYENYLIYPNPVNEYLHISNSKLNSETKLSITDLFGKQVLKEINWLSDQSIDVSELSQGVYYLTIEDNSKTSTIRFIKN